MTPNDEGKRIVVGVTGASGAVYAQRLIQCLVEANVETHVIVSPHGRQLFSDEMGMARVDGAALLGREDSRLVMQPYNDLASELSSGSTRTDGMVICPCSSNTLGQIASGLGGNLIARAAQVTLKERRRLVVVPREAPMGHLDLENCLRLSTAGAIVCPASPGFYMSPRTIADLVDFLVGKLLDLLGVPHDLKTRWSAVRREPGRREQA